MVTEQEDEEISNKIGWLKENTSPTSKVHEYMAETAEYRRTWTQNRDHSVLYMIIDGCII